MIVVCLRVVWGVLSTRSNKPLWNLQTECSLFHWKFCSAGGSNCQPHLSRPDHTYWLLPSCCHDHYASSFFDLWFQTAETFFLQIIFYSRTVLAVFFPINKVNYWFYPKVIRIKFIYKALLLKASGNLGLFQDVSRRHDRQRVKLHSTLSFGRKVFIHPLSETWRIGVKAVHMWH